MIVEQRRHHRYLAKDGLFVVFRPDFNMLGKIVDISKCGIGFEYINVDTPEFDKSLADIFKAGNNLYVSKIPCRVVYSKNLSNDKGSMDVLDTMRCGVEFMKITKEQMEELRVIFDEYVVR